MLDNSSRLRRVLIPTAVLSVGLAAGAGAYAAGVDLPRFDQNANGQTIGPVQVAAEAPDLVEVALDQGIVDLLPGDDVAAQVAGESVAFVYSADYEGPVAANPEEAAKLMAERVDADGNIWIPLYLEDGKTVIGRLNVGRVVPPEKSSDR